MLPAQRMHIEQPLIEDGSEPLVARLVGELDRGQVLLVVHELRAVVGLD